MTPTTANLLPICHRLRGFTLVELLIVCMVLGLIAQITMVQPGSSDNKRLEQADTLITTLINHAISSSWNQAQDHVVDIDGQTLRHIYDQKILRQIALPAGITIEVQATIQNRERVIPGWVISPVRWSTLYLDPGRNLSLPIESSTKDHALDLIIVHLSTDKQQRTLQFHPILGKV